MNQFPAVASYQNIALNHVEPYHELRDRALLPWVLPGSVEICRTRETQIAQAVEDAITAERNRLARELHDAVTQTLFAVSLTAEVLPDLWDVDETEARKSTEELRQLTRGALAEMRTLLFELRPAALKQARLSDLLKQLSEALMGRERLPISLEMDGDCELPCDVKVEIYRIAQESMNNIVKYAHASRVEIKVRLGTNHVHMEIMDNGIGFDPTTVKPTSLGLRIMRERAETIHAELQVVSLQGQGTTVSLDWHG
jgi:signal transduction histidine kinase